MGTTIHEETSAAQPPLNFTDGAASKVKELIEEEDNQALNETIGRFDELSVPGRRRNRLSGKCPRRTVRYQKSIRSQHMRMRLFLLGLKSQAG